MSDRERWTVYPLLFLTLGIVLKDKVTGLVNADVVVCKTLRVTDRDLAERVVLTSNAGGGLVKALGAGQRLDVLMGHADQLVGLMFTDAEGNLQQPSMLVRKALPEKPPASSEANEPADKSEGESAEEQP